MGQIRTYQSDYLRNGTEQINFKRFDYDGVYKETVDTNVLINCPEELVPLDRSLMKLYEKPLKKTEYITELNAYYSVNKNAQFLSGSDSWVIGTPPVGAINLITNDTNVADFRPKALAGNQYLMTNNVVNNSTVMITNDHQNTIVKVNQPLNYSFHYYIDTDDNAEKWGFGYRAFVQETYNSNVADTSTKVYNPATGEWSTSYQNYEGIISGNTVNSWGKQDIAFNAYTPTSNSVTSVYFGVELFYPKRFEFTSTLNFNAAFFDNIGLSEKYTVDNSITSRRTQYDYSGTFTGEYKSKNNIFSNESKKNDFFIGRVDGDFKRSRDTANKTIEQIITQEILNDNRDYMTKYEGMFRNIGDYHIGLHRKIWIDFGLELFQEPVSCYIDAIKFDVKAAQYDLRMHVPNQDDDVGSVYEVVLE